MNSLAIGALLGLVLCASAAPAAAADPAVFVVAPEPAADPWWRRARWHPRATSVQGLPVKRLHPDWCAAESLTRERFDEAVAGQALGLAMDGLSFSIEGDFNGGGAAQIAFVGAYRRCAGEQGLFVAIVEPAKDLARDRARMRFLVEAPDPGSGFAALAREPDGTLAVWWCTDCTNGHRIVFNRDKGGFFVAGPATPRR